jgi:hypothetical protein
MQAAEKQQMLASLAEGRKELLASLEDVTEALAIRAPSPGRWTILECVEHVAVSEDYLFGQILKAASVPVPLINAQREALIAIRGLDRSRRIDCPAEGLPAGRFPFLAAALQHFLAGRERTAQFVEANSDDLRAKMTTHPLIPTVNCHEVLLLMVAHPIRHARQIEEIKTELVQEAPED